MLFSEIIGHNDLKNKLIQAIQEGRIPHAQLFYGPQGSGNLAMALAYAQYLNCRNRQAQDSCGMCPSCIQFQKLAHPDLHFIYPVATTTSVKDKPKSIDFIRKWIEFLLTNKGYVNLNNWFEFIEIENKQGIINKDDCNEIVRSLGYKSFDSEYKIMVIWMVEKLFHAAAPKILKILEEPPDKTIFLLVTENIDLILATIISRTQLVKVPRINDEDLQQYLLEHYSKDPAEIRQAVNLSNGNLIEAESYLQDEAEETHYNAFRYWMQICWRKSIPDLHAFVEEHSRYTRERLKAFLSYGILVYRNCYYIHLLNDPRIRMEGEELDFIRNFSKYVHPDNILQLYKLLNEAIYHIERNANASILLMDLSLQISLQLKVPAPKKNS
ncbi:MAG: ATP-binding protein [Bacteroidales bacterium]